MVKGKKRKSVGITKKGGGLFVCSHCGQKRKYLHKIKEHYQEVHPHAIKKKPKRDGLTIHQMRARGHTNGITEDALKEAIIIAKILRDPHEGRRVARDLIEDKIKRRRMRGY